MNSPFKFLDSYAKDDQAIFFGRDREIEELYQKIFESKILLLYGVSGTGKSSLIDCGLGNKIADSDWLPVAVRRGGHMIESLFSQLNSCAVDQVDEGEISPKQIVKLIKSVYLDHFKPIYLIFDQFEELFIFGSKEERKEFIAFVKEIRDADVQCKMLFSIREEYLANITEFERMVPEIMQNRMRVEKMGRANAMDVISGPCKANGIKIEEGFEEALLSRLVPEGKEVELTYLQVYLDKIFKLGGDKKSFALKHLEQIGDVGDLLADFLEEQINELEDPDLGLLILKAFVSMQGTRKQIPEEEILDFTRTLGKPVANEELKKVLLHFVDLRVLKDRDEKGCYELRHDSLATMIYEKITLVEKELLEVKYFLDNAYTNYKNRKVFLTVEDIKYISPYLDLLFLKRELEEFIQLSRNFISRAKRRSRVIVSAVVISVLVLLVALSIWALQQRNIAIEQSEIANEQKEIALQKEMEALEATAEAALAQREKKMLEDLLIRGEGTIPATFISAKKMNILYRGVNNPVAITYGELPEEYISVRISAGLINRISKGEYIVKPGPHGDHCRISVYVEKDSATRLLGYSEFRIFNLDNPTATINGRMGGEIGYEELFDAGGISVINNISFPFEIQFEVVSFNLVVVGSGGTTLIMESNNSRFTDQQKLLLRRVRPGQYFYIQDIQALGPDGVVRTINGMVFQIEYN